MGTSAMQSTGHGGKHSSHPVHSLAMTVCMHLPAPTIASTGQAWMHLVQPMHTSSSITATIGGASIPYAGSSDFVTTPSRCASAATPSAPPGGQRSMSASPVAIASAYARQVGNPHRVHCVCGSSASMRSAIGAARSLMFNIQRSRRSW
jgi:hypothetical protein